MGTSWRLRWIAFGIEWHWFWILRGRKKGNRLLDSGEPLTSPKLIALDKRLTSHGLKAMDATNRYEKLAGITRCHTA